MAENPIDREGGVFAGTKVPWIRPFEYAESGRSLDEFFADHPEVNQEQVIAFMQSACDLFEEERKKTSTYRRLARQGKAPKWKEAKERVHCCLVDHECPHDVPTDAALFVIAGRLRVHFYVALDLVGELPDSDEQDLVVTAEHVSRWRIKLETLVQTAGWNSGEIAVWDWSQVVAGVPLKRYPDRDTSWIAHLVSPGCLLEHADVPPRPIVMVADPRTVFLTGTGSIEGQRLMLRRTLETCRGNQPLTPRPLVIDDQWSAWEELCEDENPLAAEYALHFGKA